MTAWARGALSQVAYRLVAARASIGPDVTRTALAPDHPDLPSGRDRSNR